MYFNNKNNTNIDSEFSNDNILSRILKLLNKYKLFIFIILVIIIILIIVLNFPNKEITNYLILNGEENITLYQGTDYVEPGFDAYNSKDEDLNNQVEIKSTLDTGKIGEYEITYTIGDVTKIRKINVIAKPEEYTYIYLKTINNSVNVYVKLNEIYTEPGYQVFSSTGQNLTNQVEISGSVDTSKKGNYKLIYSIVDSNGVTVSATRTVIVMDTEISLSLSPEGYTNQDVTINIGIADNYFDYILLPDNNKVTKSTYEYKVSKNGKYTFKVYNKKGIEKESTIEVKNIDKEAPTGACSGTYKNGTSLITITSKDNIGVNKYVINDKAYTNNKITLNKELKTVTITIYDVSGNTKNISCTLQNKNSSSNPSKPSSSSSSSSSSNPQNQITDNLFVGDSRTVGMCGSYKLCGTSEYIAEVGKSHSWFQNTAVPSVNNKISSKRYNIIILMGVNDVGGSESAGKKAATKYYNTVSSLATSTWSRQNIIFVSVNPVIDGYSYAYTVAVNSFNKEMKSKILSSGISNLKYCDTNSELNITTNNAKDGLHYNKATYQEIYNMIISKCI